MATPPIHHLAVRAEVARQEQAAQGVLPAPPSQGTGYGCSQCKAAGLGDIEIIATGRGFRCKTGNHTFVDNDELAASNPTHLAVTPKSVGPPKGSVPMPIHVDPKLKDALGQRFGQRLDATCAAILAALLDRKAFLVNGIDAQRISDIVARDVTSGSQLYGLVLDMIRERDQAKTTLAQNVAAGGSALVTPGQSVPAVIQLSKLTPQAQGQLRAWAVQGRMTDEQVALKWLQQSLDNKWNLIE
jgi:hypothetical protein